MRMYCPTCGRIRCHVYFSIEDQAYRCPDAHIFSSSGDAMGVSVDPLTRVERRAYYDKRVYCGKSECVSESWGDAVKGGAVSGNMDARYLYAGGKHRYNEWREAVFKRDGYKCQKCGSSEKLQAHHVKPFINNPHLVVVLDNGITLCEDCHRDVDDIHRKLMR